MALFDDLFGYGNLAPTLGSGSLANQDYSPFPAGFEQSLAQRMGFTGGPDASGLLPKDPNFQSYTAMGPTTSLPPERTLWEKLAEGLGANEPMDLNKALKELGAPPQARPGAATPAGVGASYGNPYLNIYRRSSIDPRAALKSLLGGGLV
jgi:hypothetical protein